MVFDLDGDGMAEVACKTADGTVDGKGQIQAGQTRACIRVPVDEYVDTLNIIHAMNAHLLTLQNNRRRFLQRLGAGSAILFAMPGAFAEELLLTPRQTEGPFYPDKLPLDTDNDLLIVNDGITSAVGEITHLSGRVLDSKGDPIRNALVEIWQTDNNGVYLHTRDTHAERDQHFQGFGRFMTGSTGEYYFRTIKPTLYPGRTRHIHFAVKMKGREKWTTQCYVKGEPQNARDGIYNSVRDPKAREAITVDFAPIPDSRIGALAARFDLVMGFTPEA